MKTKKLISFLLCALMILTVMPLTVFTASAQECIWDFYIGDTLYTKDQIRSGAVPGLSFSGNTLTMTNYTGTSIAAIPGGFIDEDDSPVLNINLVGTNKLTGGYFENYYPTAAKPEADDGAWFGALYSDKRDGGFGDDSKINVSGTGTLDITLAKNYSSRISSIGGKITTVETRSDVDIIGIFCSELTVNSGKVTVTYGGAGVTADLAIGVNGDVNVLNSGVLELKSNIRSATVRINGRDKASTCAVYGVYGNVLSKSNQGYFSADLATIKTDSTNVAAVKGDASYQNGYGALYLSAPAGGKTVSGSYDIPSAWTENVSYRRFAFSDAKYVYEAYGPVNTDEIAYNTSLSEIYAHEVTEKMTFPEIGEDQLFEKNYTLYSDDGFFMKETSYKTDPESGQSWYSSSWSTYTNCTEEFVYEFDAYVAPTAGRWYIPSQGNMSTSSVLDVFDEYIPFEAYGCSFGLVVMYFYTEPVITKQPAAVLYSGDSEVSVEATADESDLTFEWWMEIYDGDTLVSEFAVGDEYGDMDGYTDMDTDTMRIGGFSETDEVPGTDGNFTYGDASKVLVYCKVKSIGKTVNSNKAEYKLFEDSVVTIKTQPVNAAIDNTGKAKFTVVAEGDGLTYDWYMNDTLIQLSSNQAGKYGFSGYNTSSLTVTVQSEMGAGIILSKQFKCVVRDAHGGYAESDKVKVIDPARAPKITQQPVNCEYIVKGTNPTFKITATGDNLTYQWYWGSYALSDGAIGGFSTTGGKTATLTIDGKKTSFGTWANWDVYCVVSNDNGSATSNKVKIVEIEKPKFKTQPENFTVAPGSEATFKAEFEKTDGVTYQWYTDDGTALSDTDAAMWKISGAKTNTLKVTPKTPAAYEKGNFYCKATYKGVSVDSNTASIIKPHTCSDNTVKVSAIAPTCTAAGNKEYYKCAKCGKLYADKAATKALTEKDVTIAALGHKWDTGVVTKEATESTKGIKKYTCTVCKATKNEMYEYVKPTEPEKPEFTYGDVDCNGKIEAADARLALRGAVGLKDAGIDLVNKTSVNFLAADVDLNGKVEAADARLILRFTVKLETKLGK